IREYAREPVTWITIGAGATALTVTVGIFMALWWLLKSLFNGLDNIGRATIDAATKFGEPVVRTITDPVHHYIHTHAEHLPIPAGTLWWSWVAVSGGLFALATFGSKGARIGWTALGAVTVALVWAGAVPDAQLLSAAVTAAVWAVLSLIAFNAVAVEPDTQIVVFRRDPAAANRDE
ncbi:MAG: hypothetical protein ACRD0P_29115, partial [Stackebrandtia sp.]